MTRIIALANQKGGVGKTTTTLNLGAALAERGRRVLLVDLDPQSNLTTCTGHTVQEGDLTTYHLLHHPERSSSMTPKQVRDNVSLIPTTLDMATAEVELSGKIGREMILRKILHPLRTRYDYILIDPPPSLGLFTLNALGAANEVIIPLQSHPLALKGLGQLQLTIALMQEVNPSLQIGGIIVTLVNRRQNLDSEVEAAIRQRAGNLVFETVIPVNVRLAEASARALTIFEHDSHSIGALAYRDLAGEVIQRGTA
ncbi:MAG: ParA family protein [Chloroflexaceae bacterium]|nr:ParA family protein [Chloroflexaceae bacterium]